MVVWRQLLRKQVIYSLQSRAFRCSLISDGLCHDALLRGHLRYQNLDNRLQFPLSSLSTCQELHNDVDGDDLVGRNQIAKIPKRRLSKGLKKNNQPPKNRSRGSSKVRPRRIESEADSDTQNASESMQRRNLPMKGSWSDAGHVSDNISDAMEGDSDDGNITFLADSEDDLDSDLDIDDAKVISPDDVLRGVEKEAFNKLSEKEQEKSRRLMMDKLISSALDEPDDEEIEDVPIPEEEQRSLRVGIIGAVNAGKSSLTNFMVGTKVAAVSRKRNTTLSEILGVITRGNTQILLYDTPGLVLDILGKPSKTDTRRRSESAWQLFSHCEVLLVLVDAYRQIHKPDRRVLSLVERLGRDDNPHPRRVLVLNKVDIVENKKHLLPLAQQFEKLPGYESIFMISALTGSGVKDIMDFLDDQAVLRPWEEEPDPLNEETIRTLSMEVVREHLLDRVHEEIPYEMDHQLIDWQELEDGSLRIEQHFFLPKKGQCKIVVGRGGSKIREIGIKACEELKKLLNRKVHLFLEVKHGGGY